MGSLTDPQRRPNRDKNVERVHLDLESNEKLLKQALSRSKDKGFKGALAWSGDAAWIAEDLRLRSELELCFRQNNALFTSFENGQSIYDNYPRYCGQLFQRTYTEQISVLSNGVAYLLYQTEKLHSEVLL